MNTCGILCFLCCIYTVQCRDFYVGMFKKNDFLVASDTVYKPRVPYRQSFTKYGRQFKCPITYFRVADRLGVGRGPKVQVIRGGLLKKYVVLLITTYNLPISVNIYVGCENKMKRTTKHIKETSPVTTTTENPKKGETTKVTSDGEKKGTTIDDKKETSTNRSTGENKDVTTNVPTDTT